MFSADAPIGRVLMHNNDGANSPGGLENLPAGVSWTAPEAGPVAISGGMWQVMDFRRTEEWTLSLNGVAISGGLLSYSPLITSSRHWICLPVQAVRRCSTRRWQSVM